MKSMSKNQVRSVSLPVTNQPSQGQLMVNPFYDQQHEWSVGLCDCFNNVGQCFYAYFCWCCFLCSLAKDINEPGISTCCSGSLVTYRMKVRTALKIRGDSFDDACVVCWCPFCAALQMSNEVKRRGIA